MMFVRSAGRRPKRSAKSPKRKAPTGRIAKVIKIASATAETFTVNCVAIALTQKIRMKKSNASRDQPQSDAKNVLRCNGVSWRKGAQKPLSGRWSEGELIAPGFEPEAILD